MAAKQTESVACILTALRHRNIEFTVVRSQPPAIRRRYCTLVRRIPPLQPIAARKSSLPLSARRASAACAGSRTHAFARTPQRARARIAETGSRTNRLRSKRMAGLYCRFIMPDCNGSVKRLFLCVFGVKARQPTPAARVCPFRENARFRAYSRENARFRALS